MSMTHLVEPLTTRSLATLINNARQDPQGTLDLLAKEHTSLERADLEQLMKGIAQAAQVEFDRRQQGRV